MLASFHGMGGKLMSRPASVALLCSAILGVAASSITQAAVISQTASLPLSSTNFSPSILPGKDPIVLQKFDAQGGKRILDAVDFAFHGMIQSNFTMLFTTP